MKFERGDSILAARYLIGAHVVDSSGKQIGHVIDMEVDPKRDFQVTALELGRHGWIDRVRALRPLAHDRLGAPPRVIPWTDIERYEDGKVICKPGAKVVEMDAGPEEPTPPRTASGG
jgi:sporulation protein YlmC with PRC-barrel domain